MKANYQNRQTVGQRLDLTMLAYQEAPLVPRGGYNKPKEVLINAFSRVFVEATKTDARTVSMQKKQDKLKLTANVNITKAAESRWNNRFKAVSEMDKFNVYDVAKALNVSKDVASQCLTRWSKEGKIVGERTGPSYPIMWRVK